MTTGTLIKENVQFIMVGHDDVQVDMLLERPLLHVDVQAAGSRPPHWVWLEHM